MTGKADSADMVGSLVKAYLAKKSQVVDKILKDDEMALKNENLFGLAKQLREAITAHAIRNMTATYVTLPLASIATEVGFAGPEEAANHIYKCALSQQRTRFTCFPAHKPCHSYMFLLEYATVRISSPFSCCGCWQAVGFCGLWA